MGAAALELREVSFVADGKKILDSISWRVGAGEHWAILGPNGAGKTTLLNIACGYLWPNAGGSVFRKGRRLVDLRRLRESIGWVTASLAAEIPPREPVLRTVVSGRFAQLGLSEGPWGAARERDYRRARRYLEELGCERLAGQPFGTLSQGEQQKVLIARARMAKPYLIFFDEPCAGMDPGAREVFLRALARLGRRRKIPSLVYVTHHVEEILPMFGKVLILKEGRVAAAGASRKLLRREILEELYGVRLSLLRRGGRLWPIAR
jgi:iron complex transport system ATP-binding protein